MHFCRFMGEKVRECPPIDGEAISWMLPASVFLFLRIFADHATPDVNTRCLGFFRVVSCWLLRIEIVSKKNVAIPVVCLEATKRMFGLL